LRKIKEPVPRYRVGDWVSFLYGARRAVAQVVEDRGPIGVNGRRLYGVRLEVAPEYITTFEMPEDEMEPAVQDKEAKTTG
jgi:hypothetical protein